MGVPIAAAVFELGEDELNIALLAALRRCGAAGQKARGQQALRTQADEISSVHESSNQRPESDNAKCRMQIAKCKMKRGASESDILTFAICILPSALTALQPLRQPALGQ